MVFPRRRVLRGIVLTQMLKKRADFMYKKQIELSGTQLASYLEKPGPVTKDPIIIEDDPDETIVKVENDIVALEPLNTVEGNIESVDASYMDLKQETELNTALYQQECVMNVVSAGIEKPMEAVEMKQAADLALDLDLLNDDGTEEASVDLNRNQSLTKTPRKLYNRRRLRSGKLYRYLVGMELPNSATARSKIVKKKLVNKSNEVLGCTFCSNWKRALALHLKSGDCPLLEWRK
ncbi:uncharacterized protein LOC116163773 [Photinus pyralis]|uniref:Uncharacterized protein n=1 Tax=Photinus pyralis TaxID=7054 RepID=A0A1Y1N3E7_PHOPY|nr:uncharacterized protein LOC116163773 [Photinus pyralis]